MGCLDILLRLIGCGRRRFSYDESSFSILHDSFLFSSFISSFIIDILSFIISTVSKAAIYDENAPHRSFETATRSLSLSCCCIFPGCCRFFRRRNENPFRHRAARRGSSFWISARQRDAGQTKVVGWRDRLGPDQLRRCKRVLGSALSALICLDHLASFHHFRIW